MTAIGSFPRFAMAMLTIRAMAVLLVGLSLPAVCDVLLAVLSHEVITTFAAAWQRRGFIGIPGALLQLAWVRHGLWDWVTT